MRSARFDRTPAALLLEDGTRFLGYAFGARGITSGEVVFNTGMSGYQEVLTDPSYRAQIVTMTYPHIGNYGVNPADAESARVQVAGFIVKAPYEDFSNWRGSSSLNAYLRRNGVIGLAGIDTRALVRRLRVGGAMLGAMATGDTSQRRLQDAIDAEPPMLGRNLVDEVTCRAPYDWTEGLTRLAGETRTRPLPERPLMPYRVVAYDFGIKRNILRLLVDHGCVVTVVPASTSAADVLKRSPDGVLLSNGPGDPAAVPDVIAAIGELIGKVPIFGICLGHQLIARSLGAETFKLKFGHRGVNQPVRDMATGRVEITSQNHGFAVKPGGLGEDVLVSHINLNDGTVEGLRHNTRPLFGVQYHPEASPGPHDAAHLFGRFVAMMEAAR